jgi:NarL family two-component system sensor histidine kinase LiaS
MKKSIITTFGVAFILLFSLSMMLLAFFESSHGTGEVLDFTKDFFKVWVLLVVAALVALVITVLNFVDNQRIHREFAKDIEKLNRNELPTNPELIRVSQHISELSAELQHLSNPTTEMRAVIVEEERKRISRELHDSVSQELFAATMILSSVESSTDLTVVRSQTALALKILHEAQNEMRALLLHLRPIELDGKSLSVGMTALINELSAKIHANINYRLDEVKSTSTIEDNLFRMAQEILSNTLRHAHAENIDISLRENSGNIILTIRDDGIGFDKSDEKATSYGLANLRERTLLLGGECKVTSAPNQGTSVEIRIPKA